MEAQIKLGRIFGIKIGLHYSWLIIALLIAFSLAGHFGAAHPDWDQGVILGMAIVTALTNGRLEGMISRDQILR